MSANKLCIFHASCADGFGAALAVYQSKLYGPETEFIAAHYGEEPPDVTGKDVVIVDFSYPRETLLKMYEQAENLLVYDHHKTAQKELEGLTFCKFDMDHSGAYLAWYHLVGEVPEFIHYIEDRDLWKWALEGSKEISAALFSYPMDFELWQDFVVFWDGVWKETLYTEGGAILRYQNQQVDRAIKKWEADPQYIELLNEDHETIKAPTLNTTTLISEIGNELSKGYPCSATYFIRADGKRVYSLRSQSDGEDVSKIAKLLGGGGHARAAGFTL